MTPAELLLPLIARYGIPGAIEIVKIVQSGSTVTQEMLDRLSELSSRQAVDYERELQK